MALGDPGATAPPMDRRAAAAAATASEVDWAIDGSSSWLEAAGAVLRRAEAAAAAAGGAKGERAVRTAGDGDAPLITAE